MTRPLLTTKLHIPPIRPRLISRPRLIERLKVNLHRKLTLVSAPAGFGKTTLLSECSASCGRPVAWLALDEADNDPACFLAYLIASVQNIDADIGRGALSALQTPQAPPIASLLVGLINELATVPAPFILVLDDYHVIEAKSIHDALTFLLDHQPSQMHLVIATRSDPPLPVARLRGRGQLTELRQNDLRFTHDEAAEFLNETMGLQLSIDGITTLASRTEGWIAGLQMAAVSLRGRDDPAGFVHAFAGSHRHVLDYLVEEVLVQQPATVQTFLLQTAILDRLTAPLCDDVLGVDAFRQADGVDHPPLTASMFDTPISSQGMLEYLDRANLFVVPLDEERRWYRYHHLFADLLRQRLQQALPHTVQDLHRRAGTWYEEQGLTSAAIQHALSAEDYRRALGLIERAAEPAMMRSEITTVQGWLDALPDDVIRTRAIVCVYHACARLMKGSPIRLVDTRLQDAADADRDGSVAGEILVVRALMATYQRETQQSAELSRCALEMLPVDSLFFRSLVAGSLGLNMLYSGDFVAARQALEETVRISRQAGNLMSTVLALCHLGEMSMIEGHLHEGRAFHEQALKVAVDDQGQREPIAGLALIGLGQVLTLEHNLEGAERHFKDGIELVKRWGLAGTIGGQVGLARIRRIQGDLKGAHEAIETAERVAIQFDVMTADDDYVAIQKTLLWLAQGDVEAASRWITECGLDRDVRLYPQEDDGSDFIPFNRMLGYIIVARVCMAQNLPEEALQVLRPLRQKVETAGWTLYAVALLILEALALQLQGNIPEAMKPLARALALSEPEGIVGLFIEEGAPMLELLRYAISRGIERDFVHEIALDLLAHIETEPSATTPTPDLSMSLSQTQPLVEPLTERELAVLRLLATPLPTAEIADRLFITVSTVRSHTKNIYAKLNVHRRSEATEQAKVLKLI